jgi:membrane-associated protease RseP (regulator of RpoE activity)
MALAQKKDYAKVSERLIIVDNYIKMSIWLVLILLGLLTYYIINRGVHSITKTPVWLLWLVMMTPALLFSIWVLYFKQDQVIFPVLILISFLCCPALYVGLIQAGRINPGVKPNKNLSDPNEETSEVQDQESENDHIRPITPSEEQALRDCFPWGIYYLQNIDYRPQAILCRGKLKTLPDEAYNTIKRNVEKIFADRFLVIFQESFQGQPFFALVPNPWSKNQLQQQEDEPVTRPGLAIALLLVTLFTITLIGPEIRGLVNPGTAFDSAFLAERLPYSLGVILIFGCHELSHYIAAKWYKISSTLPYFIPFPYFPGTFGAFVQMRSPIPNRKALFDIAIAGPVGGLIVTIPLLIWGLSLSEVVPLSDKPSIFNFSALDPRFSLLLSLFSKIALGDQLKPEMALNLHPIAVAGYLGLVITALNLMPIGQLDGGKMVHAMFGQRQAAVIGQFTRFLMLGLALIQPDFMLWAIILLFMPVVDQPTLNDVTELNNQRDLSGLVCLAFLVMILLPLPGTIAQWLSF